MYTQFFSFDNCRRKIMVLQSLCICFLHGKDKVREKNSFLLISMKTYYWNTRFSFPLPFSLSYSGTSWPITPWAIFIGRHSGSLDILFYFDLGMGPGSLLLILSLENISYCFCQAVSQVGVFCYSVQLPMKEQMNEILAQTTALLGDR